MKSIIIFCFFTLAAARVKANDKDLRQLDEIEQEGPCIAQGFCTIADDCPEGQLAEPGLCPKQRSQGVECCYGLSEKETRCGHRGGICIPSAEFCSPKLTYTKATDCHENNKCCILT